ncbi:hypothetical protein ACWGIB_23740 [Streptomyces xiamenensis]
MIELPIEELNPCLIGVAMEVSTPDGTRSGFRLARYEKTVRDDQPIWILFSTEHPWRTEIHGGNRIVCAMKQEAAGRTNDFYPPQAPPVPTAPPAQPAPLHPHPAWMPPATAHR